MTELDKALEAFQQDMDDTKNQSLFFDLFLNSHFHIPTIDSKDLPGGEESVEPGHAVPLIIEAEGNDYLMLFDTEERLYDWAKAKVSYVVVAGHVVAEMSESPLHWALNVGTECSKEFVPAEISWLRDIVVKCNAEAAPSQE
ncbi:SseB family protein [Trichloromonas sp.]|uniref:SseB family protein n=1 Tax=Trichloromonas sp. TaxID=3069249 RepID=UPI003D81511C